MSRAVELLPRTGAGDSVAVPIASLVVPEHSLRRDGENFDHTLLLAETETPLPPIVVHRTTRCVIDGIHRLRAAISRGATVIEVVYFDGSADEAFVFAVRANIEHGLPLSITDRRAAAARILASHPHWSDRMIAGTTGLAAKTVAALRAGAPPNAHPRHRLGSDGRVRPLTTATGRLMAAEIISTRPSASLREIAKAAGISPGTVRDVRDRMRRGEDPVAKRCGTTGRGQLDVRCPEQRANLDVAAVLQRLGRDPSLRHNEIGRRLLRWLYLHTIDSQDCARVVESVPAHNARLIAELAAECAEQWSRISVTLRNQGSDR